MIDQFMKFLSENYLASGGIVVALFSGFLFYLKSLPGRFGFYLDKYCTSRLEVHSDTSVYGMVDKWLSHQKWLKKSNRFMIGDNGILLPALDSYTIFRNSHMIRINKSQSDLQSTTSMKFKHYIISIQIYPRSQKLMNLLLTEMKEFEVKDSLQLLIGRWGNWHVNKTLSLRSIDTVILPEKLKNDIIGDIQRFLAKEEWYIGKGIPYHRGYLLYGPPGNGKTSLIHALAGVFKRSLYFINLGNKDISDEDLRNLMSNVPKSSIIVIEDIDCFGATHSREDVDEENQPVNLSTLLNVLDGFLSPDGTIFIATTNYLEKLDEALIRAGRFDQKYMIDLPTKVEISLYLKHIYEHEFSDEFINKLVGNNMSDLQSKVLHAPSREDFEFAVYDTSV